MVSDTISMQIEIPSDNDGFVLFQCPLCGELFKIKPSDYEDDTILEIYCPNCGLCSNNYLTEDVIELAINMGENVAMDIIDREFKKLENEFKKGPITFKMDKKPKKVYEHPIHATIEALEITCYDCCNREAKIKPLLKISGHYCPFCGVKNFEY